MERAASMQRFWSSNTTTVLLIILLGLAAWVGVRVGHLDAAVRERNVLMDKAEQQPRDVRDVKISVDRPRWPTGPGDNEFYELEVFRYANTSVEEHARNVKAAIAEAMKTQPLYKKGE